MTWVRTGPAAHLTCEQVEGASAASSTRPGPGDRQPRGARCGVHPSGDRVAALPGARGPRRSARGPGPGCSGCSGPRAWRSPRAWTTWRSATTSCTGTVGLDARPQNPQLERRGTGDYASPPEQWKRGAQPTAPPLHEHHRQGQRPRLRHPPSRRGAAVAAAPPRPTAVEPVSPHASSSGASRCTTRDVGESLRGGNGVPPETRPAAIREALRKAGKQAPQGLRAANPPCRGAASGATLAANATANLARNLWSHSVIMCGHFPEGVETFEVVGAERERDPRRVVRPADAGISRRAGSAPAAPDDRQPLPTRSSTTSSPTCRATGTPRSPSRSSSCSSATG